MSPAAPMLGYALRASPAYTRFEWRGPNARRPDALPPRLREAERVVTTAFGRWRDRHTWQV